MRKGSGAQVETISGSVRIDESVARLVARLEPGEIAVVELPDLNRSSALSLLGSRPAAVLNAAPSTTGRRASLGAQLLVEGGIPVVDDLGSDVMTLAEGDRITVSGSDVYRDDLLVAAGRRRSIEELRVEQVAGWQRLEPAVESFSHAAASTWEKESAQYLEGEGVPRVPDLRGRTAIVVGEGVRSERQLRELKPFSRDFSAFLIADGAAAGMVARTLRMPDLIIGDIATTPEKILRKGRPLVLLERPDGHVLGGERASALALDYAAMTTSANSFAAAILLADTAEAKQIVTVGDSAGIDGFLEQSAGAAAAGFFIELKARQRLVSATVAKALYRPGVRTWQLILLMLAALLALTAAVLFTPVGGTLGQQLWDWLIGLWPRTGSTAAGAAGLVFGSDSV